MFSRTPMKATAVKYTAALALAVGMSMPVGPLSVPVTAGTPMWTHVVVDSQMAGDDKALVDIDGDGYLDIVVGGMAGSEPLTWYEYPNWTKHVIASAATEFTTEMDASDMDNDGDVDLVVCDGNSTNNCKYYKNPRPGGDPAVGSNWTTVTIGSGGGYVHDVRVGDYNNDAKLDVITNQGLFTQSSPTSFTKSSPSGSCFGDVDNDGDLDVVKNGAWYENPGWASHALPSGGEKVRVADINRDGKNDVVFNSGDGTADLAWYNAGDFDQRFIQQRGVGPGLRRVLRRRRGRGIGLQSSALRRRVAEPRSVSAEQVQLALIGKGRYLCDWQPGPGRVAPEGATRPGD